MTNLQIYISIGLPTLTILACIAASIVQVSGLRELVNARFDAVHDDIKELKADIREIRADLKDHAVRLKALES